MTLKQPYGSTTPHQRRKAKTAGKNVFSAKSLARALPDLHDPLIDAQLVKQYLLGISTAVIQSKSAKRNTRMSYASQDKVHAAISALGNHLDRRLNTLSGEIAAVRQEMQQGFSDVKAAQAKSDEIHNANHLELKGTLDAILKAVAKK